MKLKNVHFIHPVSCGGQITSASSGAVVGDRPGQTPFDIEMVETGGFPTVKLSRTVQGKPMSVVVPITNVAGFVLLDQAPAKK